MKYVAVSGGCDSVAVALLLWERGEDYEILFNDSAAEFPEVYSILPRLARLTGKPLHVTNNGTFFQHLSHYKFNLPTYKTRWCTYLLKRVPSEAFFAEHPAELLYTGIRADEEERIVKASGSVPIAHPLVDAGMDKPQAKALCEKYGLLHPAYAWRTNVSCWCCPFQAVSDWRGLLAHYPDLYAIAEEWEQCARQVTSRDKVFMQAQSLREMREAIETQTCLL